MNCQICTKAIGLKDDVRFMFLNMITKQRYCYHQFSVATSGNIFITRYVWSVHTVRSFSRLPWRTWSTSCPTASGTATRRCPTTFYVLCALGASLPWPTWWSSPKGTFTRPVSSAASATRKCQWVWAARTLSHTQFRTTRLAGCAACRLPFDGSKSALPALPPGAEPHQVLGLPHHGPQARAVRRAEWQHDLLQALLRLQQLYPSSQGESWVGLFGRGNNQPLSQKTCFCREMEIQKILCF